MNCVIFWIIIIIIIKHYVPIYLSRVLILKWFVQLIYIESVRIKYSVVSRALNFIELNQNQTFYFGLNLLIFSSSEKIRIFALHFRFCLVLGNFWRNVKNVGKKWKITVNNFLSTRLNRKRTANFPTFIHIYCITEWQLVEQLEPILILAQNMQILISYFRMII